MPGILGTYLDSLGASFDGSGYVKLEGLFLWFLLRHTDVKALVYDEGIKLVSTGGKFIGTIPGNIYGITLGIDIGTKLIF